MSWIFADQSFGTGSKNLLTSSAETSQSITGETARDSSSYFPRTIDAPPEHGSFYSQSAQSQIKYIQSKVGGQEVLTTSSPTFQNMTVTGSLRAGAFVVTSSQTSYTASFGSGRSIFGDSSDDQHSLTGSLEISGGLEVLHYDLSGSNQASMSIGQFAGSGSGIQNVQVPQADHIPLNTWKGSVTALQLPSGSRSTQPPGQRGIIYSGGSTPNTAINFITISTPSDASDFGDATAARRGIAGMSNGINDRAAFGGGRASPVYNIIDYITISTAANAIDFGDLYDFVWAPSGASNGPNERGLIAGGALASDEGLNAIEYITISTTGNANDFGDLTETKYYHGGADSGINDRAIFFGASPHTDNIDFVTLSTTGNAHIFGSLTQTRTATRGTSNDLNNRAVIAGDNPNTNIIEFTTIDSTGDAQDFGDMTISRGNLGMTSNGTDERGISAGGTSPETNLIDYITISVLGNALDFGDLVETAHESPAAASNAATSDWPYENALDKITLNPKDAASGSYSSITGSYTPNAISGSSATLTEEIESGSLAISSNRPPGQIGILAGGDSGVTNIDMFNISTPGNSIDFGDLTQGRRYSANVSNGILNRGIFYAGNSPGTYDIIDFITITSPGNAADFGDAAKGLIGATGISNGPNQRGVFAGGGPGSNNVISYITISTAGNSLLFGELDQQTGDYGGSLSNGVNQRGVIAGRGRTNIMEYITIDSPSNAIEFGDMSVARNHNSGVSDDTNERGLWARGQDPGGAVNTIDYITISSPGNALDFGDGLVAATETAEGGLSSGRAERGIIHQGYPSVNTMEFLTINTPGNTFDFGDRSVAKSWGAGGLSNGASFYPHAAYPQTRFSTDPMTVIQSKTEVSFASGSLQHYIASGGLFSIPNITPSASSADGPQSGSNSFVQNFPEGAIGRTGVFEVWAGLVPDQVVNLSGSSPAFTQLALGYNATGSVGSIYGFSGSSAFYASASIYNAYNVSASFSSGSALTSDSASAGRIAATALPGTNTIYQGEWKTVASGSILPGQRGISAQGTSPAGSNDVNIDYFTISTLGNAVDFGDAANEREFYANYGTSNGVLNRGILKSTTDYLDLITISTPSNAVDVTGTLYQDVTSDLGGACSNGPDSRAVIFDASQDPTLGTDSLYLYNISSQGDVHSFGNQEFNSNRFDVGSNGINQRAVRSIGYNDQRVLEYITISSLGDSTVFGEQLDTGANGYSRTATSDTNDRMLYAAYGQKYYHVNIAQLGDAFEWGDRPSAWGRFGAGASNGKDGRGVWAGGYNPGVESSTSGNGGGTMMEYVSLDTPSNGADFGDLTRRTFSPGGFDNGQSFHAVSGSTISVGQIFLSGSRLLGSGSASGSAGLGSRGFRVSSSFSGAASGSNHATGSYVEVTSRIMNTTGSGADASSSLLDFTSRSPGQRAVTGYTHSATDKTLLDAITMTSLGNAAIHGYNLHNTGTNLFGCGVSNGTGDRALHRHHGTDYQCMTISTPGNASTFGNDSATFTSAVGATSNGTDQRGVIYYNHYEYVTISTLGNAIGASSTSGYNKGMLGSNGRNQRGIIKNSTTARFMYFTISSLGNALDFGATTGTYYNGMTTNDTNDRLVHHPVNGGVVDYITISTPSDALDFGNNIFGDNGSESFSNGTGGRGFNVGDDGAEKATIAYYDIGNLGDSQVFGDLSQMATSQQGFASSNSAL